MPVPDSTAHPARPFESHVCNRIGSEHRRCLGLIFDALS